MAVAAGREPPDAAGRAVAVAAERRRLRRPSPAEEREAVPVLGGGRGRFARRRVGRDGIFAP